MVASGLYIIDDIKFEACYFSNSVQKYWNSEAQWVES